ncbi:SDR family oxidoreductase [Dyadobacter sp. CY345]|uniref:SDR family oxidoreductase n=1 Tax=Dyadobacter sp. CY345 TaxID=2909335 RepID=UPI001F1CF02E|nr:SDR family oxidoreductase [Dyadobacter sp. CY345]MCF2444026.1 SDR family oxidoreductase [Dyadobacter sp. CY345]
MKTVLITGANKSIGYETAKRLSKNGYFVYLGSRNMENGQKAVEKLRNEGYENLEVVQIDITDLNSILEAKNKIERQNGHLDVLINNAGISGALPQNASNALIDDIRKTFDTNFFGTINVVQTFLDLLRKSDSPRIVNVSSGLASLTLQSDPSWNFYAYKGASYGPSKTALNAYTIALAYELKDTAFKINVVDPGFTATDFNQHRGTGSVEDAAEFVARYALLDTDGETGKFFSKEIKEEGNQSPW